MAQVFHFIMVALTNEPLTSKKDLVFKRSVISLSISFLSFPRPINFNIQQCSDFQIARIFHVHMQLAQTVKSLFKKTIKARTRTR